MRKLAGLILLCGGLWAQRLYLSAPHATYINSTIRANQTLSLNLNNTLLRSNAITYNTRTQDAACSGDVVMVGYQGSKEHLSAIKFNTKKEHYEAKELFLNTPEDIWLLSQNASKEGQNYTLYHAMLSSCDVDDPLWNIRFEEANYDAAKKYLKLYHGRFYIYNTPLLYLPYVAFSTSHQRSTGFLFPSFSYSNNDGFVYEQPFFWAINPSFDIEFNAQLRLKRSRGLYATARFVDSYYSKGALRAGYFKDIPSYVEKKHPKHPSHYGVEFNYHSLHLFDFWRHLSLNDRLYINAIYLNDIDYLTLQKNNLKHFGLSPLQESRLNYFLFNQDYYMGLYGRYFVDTRKEKNDQTLQEIPTLHFHKYLTKTPLLPLYYSLDLKYHTYYRKSLANLRQFEASLPLEYTQSFFDDYLFMQLKEELYYSKFSFSNEDFDYDSFEYYSNLHKIRLYSSFFKQFSTTSHTFAPSITYIHPGNQNQNPTSFDQLHPHQKSLFSVGLPRRQLDISFANFIYRQNQLRLKQRLYFKYYLDTPVAFSDIGNEFTYYWGRSQLFSDITYAPHEHHLRKSTLRYSYRGDSYRFSLAHRIKNSLPDRPTDADSKNIAFDFGYQFSSHYQIFGGLSYGLDDSKQRFYRFGFKYTKSCFKASVTLKDSMVPSSSGYRQEKRIFVQLEFAPFATIEAGN